MLIGPDDLMPCSCHFVWDSLKSWDTHLKLKNRKKIKKFSKFRILNM